ncbi:MAG TPA: DoxX family protein [Kiritimatiellia bacterium]|nr:DoxX family protein [Kiritimatiellia bacterium]
MKDFLDTLAFTLLRVFAGFAMATHGYGKIFAEGADMTRFTGLVESMGFPFPAIFAWAAALSELAGGVLLALGLVTRISAGLIAVTMFVAAFILHGGDPFAKQELALLFLTVNLYFVAVGGGKWALDRFIKIG